MDRGVVGRRPLTVIEVPAGAAGVAAVQRALADDTRAWALVSRGSAGRAWPEVVDADLVIMSSGSTTVAKGVRHSRATIRWSTDTGIATLGAADWAWLVLLPPTSVATIAICSRSRTTGIDPVVWPGVGGAMRFDADAVTAWHTPAPRRATSVVSTQLARLLATDAGRRMLAGLEVVVVGGGPLPAVLADACQQWGIHAVAGYGLTETFGGCVYDGRPWPGVEVTARDGQLHIAGPMLALGYLDGTEIRSPFATGDRGAVVDGVVSVTGRLDDIVTVKGVNVWLAEAEAEALTRPGVVDAVAVALPDPVDGHRIVTYVEDADHRLPRLPNGKVDRLTLRRRAGGHSEAVD